MSAGVARPGAVVVAPRYPAARTAGDDRVVEPPGRVTEEVDRHAEHRRGAPRASRPPRARASAARELRQVGMRQRVGGELPAVRDQELDLLLRQPPRARRVPHLEIEHAGPAVAAEDRCRGRELAVVAVVERDARPGGSGRSRPKLPVQVGVLKRHGVEAVAREPADLAGEVRAGDVELRIAGVRRRVGDHVVHEDRDRIGGRVKPVPGRAEPADASVVTPSGRVGMRQRRRRRRRMSCDEGHDRDERRRRRSPRAAATMAQRRIGRS